MSKRAQIITGIRQFAEWLEATPEVDPPSHPRFLLALHTNQAVTEFAAQHGLTTTADAEGNLSTTLEFGPVIYEAYGYVDFTAHRDAMEERNARAWADKNDLQIVTRAEACARCREPFDPADSNHDGRARFQQTDYCRGCVGRCHDSGSTDHRCVICA